MLLTTEQGAQELLDLSAEQELADRHAELQFAAAMSGLTILRHALTPVTFVSSMSHMPAARKRSAAVCLLVSGS